jgi:hypothetical protein
MHPRGDHFRHYGIEARQHAAQASDPSVREAFEKVAENWFAMAEQA